jgi:hypothetical protein
MAALNNGAQSLEGTGSPLEKNQVSHEFAQLLIVRPFAELAPAAAGWLRATIPTGLSGPLPLRFILDKRN